MVSLLCRYLYDATTEENKKGTHMNAKIKEQDFLWFHGNSHNIIFSARLEMNLN